MLLLTLLLLTSVLADSKGDSNMILTSSGISDDIAMAIAGYMFHR